MDGNGFFTEYFGEHKKSTVIHNGADTQYIDSVAPLGNSKLEKYEIILIDKDNINLNFKDNNNNKVNNFYNNSLYVNNIKRAHGFGGGNNLWHGILTKLENSDFKTIDNLSLFSVSLSWVNSQMKS